MFNVSQNYYSNLTPVAKSTYTSSTDRFVVSRSSPPDELSSLSAWNKHKLIRSETPHYLIFYRPQLLITFPVPSDGKALVRAEHRFSEICRALRKTDTVPRRRTLLEKREGPQERRTRRNKLREPRRRGGKVKKIKHSKRPSAGEQNHIHKRPPLKYKAITNVSNYINLLVRKHTTVKIN
jgi:hypothetical protein